MLSRSVLAEPAPSAPLAGTSRLPRRAAYTRCLRCAGAPRRPASGSGLSLPFRPDMPSSLTPGSSTSHVSSLRDADTAFAEIRAARHSQHSRNPFHARPVFRGFTGSPLLRPVRLLAPLDGSDRVSPATGGFYIQASGGSVALPAAGYDYNSTGLLCWRDFHPQEWQLASLHPILRASPKGQVRRASLNRFDPDLARDRRDHGSEEGGHSCGTAMYLPLHLHPACLLHLEQSRADG